MSSNIIQEDSEISTNKQKSESANRNDNKIQPVIRKQCVNDIIHHLPVSIKNRIKALKKIQFSTTLIEAQFYKEIHALENKYHALYEPYYEKRTQIIDGTYAPTQEECLWTLDDALIETKDQKNEACGEVVPEEHSDYLGIPNFWLTIFQNVSLLSDYIQEYDEPILKHLHDIKLSHDLEPMGFTLQFYFTPNDYFTNLVLVKRYYLKCLPDEDEPFTFEGPAIYKSEGCTIDWNKDKNVTIKFVKKKQRHKSKGSIRTVLKQVPNDSFFNFFSPPTLPDDPLQFDEETQNALASDFEIGHYLRERIVPKAVLYYTGEILDDDEDDEFDEEIENSDDDEDDSKSIESSQESANRIIKL